MRLIDKDRAKDILERYANAPHVMMEGGTMAIAIDTCIRLLDNCPTIEMFECKDCKHRYQYEDWDRDRAESFVCHECRLHNKDFGEDGFCSYGERKDGAEDG